MRMDPAWFWRPKPIEHPAVRLVCFPYACGGTQTFRTWPGHLPPEVEVNAVQLPGRERRYTEPPFRRLDALVDALVAAIREGEGPRVAFFGHSMGALVAFESARKLYEVGHPAAPAWLFVSGRRAPHKQRRGQQILHTLPEPELVRFLQELGGTPAGVFEDPDLRQVVVRLARADFELLETYRYRPGPPLPCPITVFRGTHDPAVDLEEAQAWADHTSAAFDLHELPGDHFFVNTATDLLLARIAAALTSITRFPNRPETSARVHSRELEPGVPHRARGR